MGTKIAPHSRKRATPTTWDDIVWLRLRKALAAMLGLWIAYFLVVHMFIGTLNRIIVPILGVPLGVLLVAHGSLVMFLILLLMFIKRPVGAHIRSGAEQFVSK